MFSAFLVLGLLLPGVWGTGANPSCEELVPKSIDASICDDIRSAVFILRFAVRDVDQKVKETVLTALKEAQRILDSTTARTIADVKDVYSRRKRSLDTDLESESRTAAENAAKNIDEAVKTAEKKIRSSVSHAVFNADIQNENIKDEALNLLRKVLNKRSVAMEKRLVHRRTPYDVQAALSGAAEEVKSAMKDAVTTSIKEHRNIIDLFSSRLKPLFHKANFKGSVEKAEQDIEEVAINSSLNFIQFYDSSTTVAIGKAIKSVEGLLMKFDNIGNDPSVLYIMKSLLESAGASVSKVVVETQQGIDDEIRSTIMAAAKKMFNDYQTIVGIMKKHGV